MSEEYEGVPSFPLSFPSSSSKAAPVMWNYTKAQKARTPSFWPEELEKMGHCGPERQKHQKGKTVNEEFLIICMNKH